jgi:hypothetical protein
MSPLFGGKDKDRPPVALPLLSPEQLTAMPLAELGALILPVWGAGETTPYRWRDGEEAPNRLAAALTGQRAPISFNSSTPFSGPHAKAIGEAVQDLERAGLLLRTYSTESGSLLTITRLGERAIAEGTVARHLRALGE